MKLQNILAKSFVAIIKRGQIYLIIEPKDGTHV